MKCPYCGIGQMDSHLVENHKTKINGIDIEIAEAKLQRCDTCNRIAVPAGEIKRWEKLQHEVLLVKRTIPDASKVRWIRESLKYSVPDFARLLGVTRQTIYLWEKSENRTLQLGPSALLLNLLSAELQGTIEGVHDKLRAFAFDQPQPQAEILVLDVHHIAGKPTIQSRSQPINRCIRDVPKGGRFFGDLATCSTN